MSIDKVEIKDYSTKGLEKGRKVTVSEFAGRLCLEISDGGSKCEILMKDLRKAWEAVREFDHD